MNPFPAGIDTDQAILQAVAAGDPEGVAALYRRHGAKMVAFARRYVGDLGTAEDVVVGLMGRWLERPPRTSAVEHATAFLATSVYHAAIDWIRRERTEQGRPPRPEPPTASAVASPIKEPDPGASRESMRGQLAAAMERLPDADRLLLEAHYGRALTTEECMEQLGVTRAAFHQRVHRAREHLARLLEVRQ